MKLVDNWRTWHRRWSIWLGTIGSTLTGWFLIWPDAALSAWNSLPPELRSAIPSNYVPKIGVAIFVLSMLAQLVKQQKLQIQANKNANS